MSLLVAVMLFAGVALWSAAIVVLDLRTRALCARVNLLHERLGEVGRIAQDARVLARKRVVGGRAGR